MKPNNLKFAKAHKGRLNFGIKYDTISFGGRYALIANEPFRFKDTQISALVLALKRQLKRDGTPILRVFPNIPVSKKPSEVRMGKGKGSIDHYIARVKKGKILVEISGANDFKAVTALNIARSKIPAATKIIGL